MRLSPHPSPCGRPLPSGPLPTPRWVCDPTSSLRHLRRSEQVPAANEAEPKARPPMSPREISPSLENQLLLSRVDEDFTNVVHMFHKRCVMPTLALDAQRYASGEVQSVA